MRRRPVLLRGLALASAALFAVSGSVFALSGVYHRPYGKDDIYVTSDANTDRWPLDPYAGQIEYIKMATWPIESGDSVVVNWSKNTDGISRQASAAWQFNSGSNSYWQAAICDPSHSTQGSSDVCNEGDKVTYTVVASQTGGATMSIGPYSYPTRKAPVSGDYYVYLTSVERERRRQPRRVVRQRNHSRGIIGVEGVPSTRCHRSRARGSSPSCNCPVSSLRKERSGQPPAPVIDRPEEAERGYDTAIVPDRVDAG